MILRPINFNTTLGSIDVEDATNVLSEGYALVSELRDFLDLLVEEHEYDKANPGGDYQQDQLDGIEAMSISLDYGTLSMFAEGMFASSDSTQRRIHNAVHYLEQFKERINEHSIAYAFLTTEDVQTLKDLVNGALSELVYFLYYEFEMNITQKTCADLEKMEVNIVLQRFADMNGLVIEQIVLKMQALLKQHRPTLTIFEQFPELEEEFYNVAGSYIKDFETLSEYVTPEIVKAVITGTADVEKVISDLEAKIAQGDA